MYTKQEIQQFIDVFHNCTIPDDVYFHWCIVKDSIDRFEWYELVIFAVCFGNRYDNMEIFKNYYGADPKYSLYRTHLLPILGYNVNSYETGWDNKMQNIDWKYDTLKDMVLNDPNLKYEKLKLSK